MMANMLGRDEAIHLAKVNPGLGVGGYLVLTCEAAKTFGESIASFTN